MCVRTLKERLEQPALQLQQAPSLPGHFQHCSQRLFDPCAAASPSCDLAAPPQWATWPANQSTFAHGFLLNNRCRGNSRQTSSLFNDHAALLCYRHHKVCSVTMQHCYVTDITQCAMHSRLSNVQHRNRCIANPFSDIRECTKDIWLLAERRCMHKKHTGNQNAPGAW
jgi:hypothetical protein